MDSGKEKWWIGVAAVVAALVIGLIVNFPSSNTSSSTAAQSPATPAASTASSSAIPATQTAQPDATQQTSTTTVASSNDYERARWDPIHFKPAIDKAKDADCLKCHQEVIDTKVRDASPAGLKTANTLAWYQTLDTYEGEQMTFHQRHLTAPFIKKVANMSCTTCHQGNDPREEIGNSSASLQEGLTMRKMVDPNVCLMCHGKFPHEVMGLPGPWEQSGATFQNNCLLCHAGIRTVRHKVNFLNADAIEKEGAANSDTCYGCHGGRAWYRTSFPYPRHPWPGATPTPDWAKDRPTESDLRFLIQGSQP
ncbi:MAG TPA: hypothetical protein PLE99_10680 [Candidatus Thiothrix moscowensis]|uniref:hypothetical protein n=1 Tax=unclassified Thiothrix TaxID=2636184 RepID=UPI0025E5A838|nr:MULTISPECIES: hypothetical protein [unclassified Thiothrix]HRJ53224.1 hypothetical protein [Candidatus Thiothrix moscowensis]HRJ93206.1 hypothetical protein [Candidatus Thiothrix moscowensis]